MTDEQVIVALGDTAVVAGLAGKNQTAVSNWKARGIPWHMRPLIQSIARRKRIKLPDSFLLEQRPSPSRTSPIEETVK